ncbi:SEC-C metal-binding domain-containing protein [Paenibacillus daejeonensis]|uniref:SEC-C metal-binding domain-containing protein n=1 Tax=Paenibacillus daejeonensis TaxID=135193 RepID=UPI000A01E82E|nr:SEC-C metal-binding domain-containing protein [Paenibacillus daejeonensis]
MQKLGRNDNCHCGSGKKYKKCCLDKDQESNITRIGPKAEPEWNLEDAMNNVTRFDSAAPEFNLEKAMNEELVWDIPIHLEVAKLFVEHTSGRYDDEDIYDLVVIWNQFAAENQPIIRKVAVFPAVLENMLAILTDTFITQADLARKYGVSAATISNKMDQVFDYFVAQWEAMEDSVGEPPMNLQSRNSMEAQMKAIQDMLANQDFETMEEAQAFLKNLMQNDGAMPAPAVQIGSNNKAKGRNAAALLDQAMSQNDPVKRERLARQVIEVNPDEADAYSILGELAPNPRVAAYYYREGMLAGERALGEKRFKAAKGHFWMDVETRPYMRAKLNYAQTCATMFNQEEAILQLEEMLELNPNDNQGARDLLLMAYLEEHEYKKASQLITAYEEDASAWFTYSRVLVEQGLDKPESTIRHMLRLAIEANPYVPAYLIGKKKLPKKSPEYVGFGDDREAIYYVQGNFHLWQLQPKLTKLLEGMI